MTVGWYVHHHGSGHLHRFLAVREHLGPDVVGMGSLPRPAAVPPGGWIELPGDVPDGEPDDPTAGGALHWVPRGTPGLRDRTAAIAAWVAAARPAVLVVDVSVEIALLGRLLSVPTVLVAQRGRRTDRAHRLAYDGASAVLAPWTSATHAPGDGPPEERLVLCGAVSRFDERHARVPVPRPANASGPPAAAAGPTGSAEPRAGTHPPVGPAPRRVLLLVGAGGQALRAVDVAAAAASTPGLVWDVAGALRVPDAPGVVDHGPRADVRALLREADVVVGTAGGNVVAEVAAARRPLVLLPQDRPFDEQHRQAELLAGAGLATALPAWPAAEAWPGLLQHAIGRGTDRWAVHHDGRGAHRMAAAIRAVGEGRDPVVAASEILGTAAPRGHPEPSADTTLLSAGAPSRATPSSVAASRVQACA